MEAFPGEAQKENWKEGRAMKWVKASEFKADCAQLSEGASGPVLVVKNGKPVGAFGPDRRGKGRFKLGENIGGGRILGDIVSPIPGLWDGREEDFDLMTSRPRRR